MAVLAMNKIQILGLKKDLQKVLAYLQESGLVQIDNVSVKEEAASEKRCSSGKESSPEKTAGYAEILESIESDNEEIDHKVAQLDFAIKLLKGHAKKRPVWAGKPSLTAKKAREIVEKFDYEKVVKDCQELEEKKVADENEITQLKAEKQILTDWKHLPFELDTPRETETTRIYTGYLPKADYEAFRKEISKISNLTSIHKIDADETSVKSVVISSKKHENEVKILFGKFKFQEVELPSYNMLPKKRLEKIEERMMELEEEMTKHEAKFKRLAENFEKLQVTHDVFLWEQEESHVHEKLKGTKFSFIIEGWVAKLDEKKLKEGLEKTATTAIEKIKPAEGEDPPIYLHNKKATWPFAFITKLYGFPKPDEIDPTPFLAGFFIIFFGLCLTDVGYGLSLFLITLIALKFFKLSKEMKRLMQLLMIGGIITIGAGVLFGGYFGMTVEQAPQFMVEGDKFKFQLINPVEGNGPLTFLILSMILGVIHIFFGNLVDAIWKIKQKQYLDAIFDDFLWIYFISVLIAFGLSSKGIVIPAEYSEILKTGLLAGLGVIILTQGRKQKNIFAKIGVGFLVLYSRVVGYLSDFLSYSRIMALGMGTAIIASAGNTLAGIIYEVNPIIGLIGAILILLVAHMGNLVLSALGAFIHSARLQFVEFFSKFMEGGGTEFKPFRRKSKYIQIIK